MHKRDSIIFPFSGTIITTGASLQSDGFSIDKMTILQAESQSCLIPTVFQVTQSRKFFLRLISSNMFALKPGKHTSHQDEWGTWHHHLEKYHHSTENGMFLTVESYSQCQHLRFSSVASAHIRNDEFCMCTSVGFFCYCSMWHSYCWGYDFPFTQEDPSSNNTGLQETFCLLKCLSKRISEYPHFS